MIPVQPVLYKSRTAMSQTKRVAVIGAGIVGLSVALWLQRAGVRDVILIDKAPPGGGASFGNAGVMADYARVPFANWAQFKQLPRALLDRSSPVAVRRHYLPSMLRYAAGFARACTPSRFHAGCRALVALQRTAVQDTTTLLQHAGATSLVRDSGVLALSSSRAGLQQALAGHVGLRERLGARAAPLSAAEAAALEPAVADFHAGGIYYPGGRYARDPHELCLRYASQLARAGGRFVRLEVESIQAALPALAIPVTCACLMARSARGRADASGRWMFDRDGLRGTGAPRGAVAGSRPVIMWWYVQERRGRGWPARWACACSWSANGATN